MESLALSHSFVAYESPESELQVKSLDELGLKIPNSAWVGVAGIAVALSVLSVTGEAQASCGYSRCGSKHSHRSHNSYAEVATNGGRLNIRHRPDRCSHVIGKLYPGDNVKLTGRYRNGWAQLKGGGWVSASWLS
ncbi:SH3 domain-containing protein [Microcoleus sp. MOSTC5]|uniref:SH3 domain-containing protein n=1 Tax=Microcoleus sp. MOSTC5 TaxID=3055378 RepID=UPI002FD3EBE6